MTLNHQCCVSKKFNTNLSFCFTEPLLLKFYCRLPKTKHFVCCQWQQSTSYIWKFDEKQDCGKRQNSERKHNPAGTSQNTNRFLRRQKNTGSVSQQRSLRIFVFFCLQNTNIFSCKFMKQNSSACRRTLSSILMWRCLFLWNQDILFYFFLN